jgi:hypothetical protein
VSDTTTFAEMYAEHKRTSEVTVLEPGRYQLTVDACIPRKSAKGSWGLQPIYKLATGPDAGARVMAGGIYPGEAGSAGGRAAFFRKLQLFGLDENFFVNSIGNLSGEDAMKVIAKALVGRVIEADLTISDFTGEPRNELAFGIKLISSPDLPSVGGVPNIPAPAVAPPVTQAVAPPATVADEEPAF